MSTQPGDDRSEHDRFVSQSVETLVAQTNAHTAAWRLGEEEEWTVDQERGTIRFSFADGTVATARLQIVGTYNTEDEAWLWAWNNPSVRGPLRGHALAAKAWGEERGLEAYTTSELRCTEMEAWEFTAVAARLGRADGAYRGRSGVAWVYLTFGDVELRRAE